MSLPDHVEAVAVKNSVTAELAALKTRGERLAEQQAKLDADLARAIEHARPLMSMDEIASRAGTTRTTLYRCERRHA